MLRLTFKAGDAPAASTPTTALSCRTARVSKPIRLRLRFKKSKANKPQQPKIYLPLGRMIKIAALNEQKRHREMKRRSQLV
ncbi:hypothetical protein V1512DRAFT_245851 [Lipomyces arxii]|uniref:uncharacterized protein n=1 Tax=Lipomyces arxii TaxID=56418 RepID=UPI0034CFD0DF